MRYGVLLVVIECALAFGCVTANQSHNESEPAAPAISNQSYGQLGSQPNANEVASETASSTNVSNMPSTSSAASLPGDIGGGLKHMRKPFIDSLSKWKLETPVNLHVLATHFDRNLPPEKFREQFDISDGDKLLTRVSIWDNVQELELSRWIDTYADYLRKTGPTESLSPAGVRDGQLVYVYQYEASCSGPATRIAVFSEGNHIISVMTPDADDPQSNESFLTVVNSVARNESK